MQAVYEIMEVPRTQMHDKGVFKTMKKIVQEEENEKKKEGTEDSDKDGAGKPSSELNLFRT